MYAVTKFPIEGPVLLTPKRFSDERGWFMETYRRSAFKDAVGVDARFVQDNHSYSQRHGTVRGLHAQMPPHDQGKLVRCVSGALMDVAVDIRKSSPTYGQHITAELTADNGAQLWIPAGFLHGFETLEDHTAISYKQTNYYLPGAEITTLWHDSALKIKWRTDIDSAHVSPKDMAANGLSNLETPFA